MLSGVLLVLRLPCKKPWQYCILSRPAIRVRG
jgi:hypothetical protein